MNNEPETLKDMKQLTDGALLKIVTTDYERHLPTEIDSAGAELGRRGFQLLLTGKDFHVITPRGIELMPGDDPDPAPDLPQSPSDAAPDLAKFPSDHAAAPIPADSHGNDRTGLNWSRIWKFTLLLYGGTFIAGFFYGVLARLYIIPGNKRQDSYANIMETFPDWLQIAQGLTAMGVVAGVFILLSYRQQQRPFMHVLLVGMMGSLLSIINLFMGVPVAQWLTGVLYMLVLSVISVSIGLGLRARKEIAQLKVPAPSA